jgi:hypothetical protein
VRYCAYHCRTCGGHFTSLEAFDAHRRNCECVWPDDSGLVEIPNAACKLADPDTPEIGVTLYESGRTQRYRDYRRAYERRETAQTGRKRAPEKKRAAA